MAQAMASSSPKSHVLEPLGPGLWGLSDEVRLPGGFRLPVRMTVMALDDGTLALHSPVPLTDAVAAEIQALGPVAHVIAPSALHHLHVAACLERYPSALCHAPAALRRKRPDLRVDRELPLAGAFSLGAGLRGLAIEGAPGVQEAVFVHEGSGSLLVTDLLFNILQPPGWATRMLLTCTGTRGKLAHSRIWKVYVKDRARFSGSTEQLFSWRFDRLVPCHGEVIESGAHEAVARVLKQR